MVEIFNPSIVFILIQASILLYIVCIFYVVQLKLRGKIHINNYYLLGCGIGCFLIPLLGWFFYLLIIKVKAGYEIEAKNKR
jgi:hypothetical protein